MEKTSRKSLMRILLLSCPVLILSLIIVRSNAASSHAPSSAPSVYIVYTEAPREGVNPKAYHLKTLASVYGSEEEAKGALIYSYKTATSGFSARLTIQQALQLQKQPGVLSVVPDQAVQTHYRTSLDV
ncbi:hypothetical protein Leryth_003152 [Lithospermum erythrorhizon]|nr:hypothetical protein Leryth_003152 [Lithospermum erythrorhizon]